jgi:hypothetical protein
MQNRTKSVKLTDIYNPSENIINAIRRVCYNVDDLCKIHSSIESMLEELRMDKFSPTLKQQLIEISQQKVV